VNFLNVYNTPTASSVLYKLLAERPVENRISHENMPTREEHMVFVLSRPFRYWYLIEVNGTPVGALEVTDLNEIGVAIFKEHQRKGYATEALKLFLLRHDPLPAIPAKRNRHWLANIATRNEASKEFFRKSGFKPLQETYVL
jgi:RimJ/RimL family protein N-acetyltransferase